MRVNAAERVVVRAMVDEGWKSSRTRRQGKGDVRKMREGVGKIEEVDGRLGRGETLTERVERGSRGNVSKSLISCSP